MKKLLFLILFLGIQPIYSQSDTIKYQVKEDILVTAPRSSISLKNISFSTSIVQNDFLKTMQRNVSIDEALKIVPGVKIDNQANGNRIHLSVRAVGILSERGVRGIRFLQDEIPLNDPTGFAPDLFDIDLSNIDRIEVLRGPSASLYGGSASGGIINIITKNSPDVPLFGEATGTIGSNSFWKASGQFGGNVNNINYRLSFGRTMGDGYRQHTHFWGNTFYGKFTYSPNENIKLTPIAAYSNFYHENPEGINLQQYLEDPKQPNPDAIPYNEYLQTERNTFGLNGLLIFKNSEVQFNGYTKRTKFTEANNHTFNYRTIITPGASVQYSYSYSLPEESFKNKISAGSDFQWQKINEYRVENVLSVPGSTKLSDEEIRQSSIGLFLFDNMNFSNKLDLMLSVRYDKMENKLDDIMKVSYDASGNADFSKTTFRIGANYALLKEANIFINWGQGFLPPATEELAQNPDNFGGFNSHLKYSTSNGIDFGCRGSLLENLFYDITMFYLKTENDFDRYRITDSLRNQETFYRNIGSSNRIGIEFYTEFAPINSLNLKLAYTFSHFTYTNAEPIKIVMDDPTILKFIKDGNYLPNTPQHQFYFDADYTLPNNIFLGAGIEVQSKSYIDGANIEAEAVDGFALINCRAGYVLTNNNTRIELVLHAKNLADQKYVAFSEPDPGGNAYQPGAGREFFGSIKIHL